MGQTAPRRRSFRGAGGLLLLGLACAQVLDTDGIKIIGPDHIVIADASPAPPCTPQQLRCEGSALQICRADLSGFRTARVCSTPELCCADASKCATPGCQPPACTTGDFRCDGPLLSACNEGQTGWTPVSTCASAAQCNAKRGGCEDAPCNPATPDVQCSDAQLQRCGATGWSQGEQCPTRALCDDSASPPSCRKTGCVDVRGENAATVSSPFRCNNGDLLRCNDDQTEFEFVETCLNLLHCNDLREVVGDPQAAQLSLGDLAQLGCTAPFCTPGKFACDGSKLMRCNVYRTGYIVDQDCGSPGRCSASTGSCSAEDCVPGTLQCSGKELQLCTPERNWQLKETCAGAAQCDPTGAGSCRAPVCEVTQYRCNGSSLERCNIDGTDWIAVQSCQSEALCDAPAKRCDPPRCEAGQQRCSPDGKLERCSSGREAWDVVQDCRQLAQLPANASPEQISGTCDLSGAGRCNSAPGCPTGALRCNGQYLERCRDNAWQAQQWCATSALCDASGSGSCGMPLCKPGEERCVTLGATTVVAMPGEPTLGLTLQACNSAGDGFTNVRDCPADSLCDARHGQCDLCEPLLPLCFGSSLYLCSADGQERELEKACKSGCVLDAKNQNRPTCQEDLPPDSP